MLQFALEFESGGCIGIYDSWGEAVMERNILAEEGVMVDVVAFEPNHTRLVASFWRRLEARLGCKA